MGSTHRKKQNDAFELTNDDIKYWRRVFRIKPHDRVWCREQRELFLKEHEQRRIYKDQQSCKEYYEMV